MAEMKLGGVAPKIVTSHSALISQNKHEGNIFFSSIGGERTRYDATEDLEDSFDLPPERQIKNEDKLNRLLCRKDFRRKA